MSVKGLKHIMNFEDGDQGAIKLDRVCRMLRAMDRVSYSVTQHEGESGLVLWAYGRITKALHQELKARAIGVVFAIDASAEMIGFPKAEYITKTSVRDYGKEDGFVTLASEERL